MENLTIWRCELEIIEEQKIHIPAQARILSVQIISFYIYLYALADPMLPLKEKIIYMFKTADSIPNDFQTSVHIGTFQQGNVFHVFTKTY